MSYDVLGTQLCPKLHRPSRGDFTQFPHVSGGCLSIYPYLVVLRLRHPGDVDRNPVGVTLLKGLRLALDGLRRMRLGLTRKV